MAIMAALMLQLCLFMEVDSYSSHSDKITRLPGQPHVGFQQFSGYVSVNDDDMKHKALFYYFVEAEIDPASKPLVLWLNGGKQLAFFIYGKKEVSFVTFLPSHSCNKKPTSECHVI